jgi:lysophospholipase L1-like esterase
MRHDAEFRHDTLQVHPGLDRLTTASNHRPCWRWGLSALLAVVAPALLGTALVPAVFAGDFDQDHWVSAWQGSPTPGGTFYSPGCPSDVGLNSQTVRNIIYPTVGGDGVRVRISNAGGSTPLSVGASAIAVSVNATAGTVAGTSHALFFHGKNSILIAAGAEALSDPVEMKVTAYEALTLSVYLPGATGPATQHYIANQTNYLGAGDQTEVSAAAGYTQPISCWMFISGLDTRTSPHVLGALVTLGDSITDGYLSTANTNRRFPDDIARRLLARNGLTMSVSNAASTGNEILYIRPQLEFGYPVQMRLDRDVLDQTDARAVILLEGVNDIGNNSAQASDLIATDLQIIHQAHAAGLKIYGGTLTPFAGSNAIYGGDYGTPAGEAQREILNQWIRTSGAFDGVIDFDKAIRDPSNPLQILPAYQGDPLHPNDAGYQAMANAVNLDQIIGDILRDGSREH